MDDALRKQRALALASPYYFVKAVLKNPDLDKDIHGKALEQLVDRMKGGWANKYQWYEWFRGALKSSTFTQGFSVWLVLPSDEKDAQAAVDAGYCTREEFEARAKLRNQNYAQLIAFESADNAKKKLSHVKRQFEENQLFRLLFPEIAYNKTETPWNDSMFTIRRDPSKHSPPDPSFEARGTIGAIQSAHYDVIWVDDPVGKAAIKSDIVMADTLEWFGQLNGVEQLGGKTWRFGVSNRWGFNDLNSYLRLNEPHWEFSRMDVAHFGPGGEMIPNWPEVYPLEVIEQKRQSMTDDEFFCQYMNNPRVSGGAEMDPADIHRFKVVDDGELTCSCGNTYSVAAMNRYMHFDPYAAKGRFSRSRPAISITGYTADKHVFLLDSFTKKESHKLIFRKIYELNTRWNPLFMTYEDVNSQNLAEENLRTLAESGEFKQKGYRRIKRFVPVTTKGKPMEIRVRDFLGALISEGRFGVHEKNEEFLQMAETFPMAVTEHDYDLADSIAQGAAVCRYPLDRETELERDEAEDRYRASLERGYTWHAA